MSHTDIQWSGGSGTQYGFFIHTLPYTCGTGQDGNYIFAKPVNNGWHAVYIGEGDINDRVNDPEHYQCAARKGATHVHVHLNANQQARRNEESDLLSGNPEAYEPSGCNRQIGG